MDFFQFVAAEKRVENPAGAEKGQRRRAGDVPQGERRHGLFLEQRQLQGDSWLKTICIFYNA